MKIKISPLLIPLAIAAYFGKYLDMFLLAYLVATLHELIHIITAKVCKIKTESVHIMPFGVCGILESSIIKSPVSEIIIALSGPLFNLICYIVITYLVSIGFSHPLLSYSRYLNLSMAVLNLIPCLPLDGSRVLRALLTLKIGGLKAYLTVIKLSRILIFMILSTTITILLVTKFNFSLILIGAFLLGNLGREQKSISFMALKELLNHKEKLYKDEINHISHIAVYENMPARKVLKTFSYHKYYLINVLDDSENIIKTISESQVITALTEKSIRIKMGEI